jgi:pimeloyl-ACP methyl ester carboxylesterase
MSSKIPPQRVRFFRVPRANVNGIELYYEETGSGYPVVFCHEFGGDYRAWDPQVRFFDRLYRCVTYSHRGFPPSAVPRRLEDYSQELLIEDLRSLVADQLGISSAHFVGFSMGGSVVLNFALKHPALCKSIVVVGTGAGSTNRERFEQDVQNVLGLIRSQGITRFAETYSEGPIRQPYKRKDPHGWAVFREQLAQHSAEGQSLTMEGVMLRRPRIFSLEDQLRQLQVPTLVAIGDEDEPCVDVAVFLKRTVPSCGLLVLPQSGHAINLEEPATFNAQVLDFFRLVEADRWAKRANVTTAMLAP